VAIGGFRLRAAVNDQKFEIAVIPADTVLKARDVYLLTSHRFIGPVPDQLYQTDIPASVGIALENRAGVVDMFGTTDATPFLCGEKPPPSADPDPLRRISFNRVQFFGNNAFDFVRKMATPGWRTWP
jgi:hypothetical protein